MARTVPFLSAGGLLLFAVSSAQTEPSSKLSRAAKATPGSTCLVFINGPSFDEHLAQLAARVQGVAGEDQQVGRLARLHTAVRLVEAEEDGGAGGQCFEGSLAGQTIAYQVSDGKQRKILGREQFALAG